MSEPRPIHLIRGTDPLFVSETVTTMVDTLVGTADRSFVLDEFAGEDYELGAVVDAASTPPLFGDRRVVVARGAGRFSKTDDVAPLIAYLADPMESSVIVLVWEPGAAQQRLSAIPKKLSAAIDAAGGEVISSDPGTSRGARDTWWHDVFDGAGVTLTRDAQMLVRDRVGEDLSTVPGLLRLLEGAHGAGASLDVDDVEPFLGRAGSVPPWDLTDAIDRSDAAGALDALHRMLAAGDRHPLQVMATLASHFLRIARLSGADVRGEREAADLLGMKGSTFPAKKALGSARNLGPERARRAVELCAEADLTLRGGGVAWPGDLTLEVLVARLSRLAGRGGSTRPGSGGPSAGRRGAGRATPRGSLSSRR